LLKADQISAVLGLHLMDALFELFDGAAMSLGLFVRLLCNSAIQDSGAFQLLFEFAGTLTQAGEIGGVFVFQLMDALLVLLNGRAIGLGLFLGLSGEVVVVEGRLLELAFEIFGMLLEAVEAGVAFGFHLADALRELINGGAMGLGLFCGLRGDVVVALDRLLELILKLAGTALEGGEIGAGFGLYLADVLLKLVDGSALRLLLIGGLRGEAFVAENCLLEFVFQLL